MAGRPLKRKARDITAECFGDTMAGGSKRQGSFLLLELESGAPVKSKGWPWIQACLRGVLGDDKAEKVSFLDEKLLIRTKDSVQTEKLMRVKKFADLAVKVQKHEKLNESKGTIYAEDLKELDESEVVEGLREHGVKEAKQVWKRMGTRLIKTPAFVLTFDLMVPPEKIEMDYVSYTVRRSYPRPRQCLACGKLGHTYHMCRAAPTCLRCGDPKHGSGTLSCVMKCVNCGENDHVSLNSVCPRFREEKEVVKVKMDKGISYPEARQQVMQRIGRDNSMTTSFAAVAAKSAASTGLGSVGDRLEKVEKCLMTVVELLTKLTQDKVAEKAGSDDRREKTVVQVQGKNNEGGVCDGDQRMSREAEVRQDIDKGDAANHRNHVEVEQGCDDPVVRDNPVARDEAPGFWQVVKSPRGKRKEDGARGGHSSCVPEASQELGYSDTSGPQYFSAQTLEELKMQEEEIYNT